MIERGDEVCESWYADVAVDPEGEGGVNDMAVDDVVAWCPGCSAGAKSYTKDNITPL